MPRPAHRSRLATLGGSADSASSAMRRRRTSCDVALDRASTAPPSARRAASTRRSTPSSVTFCTSQSSRSPFGMATANVNGSARGGSVTISLAACSVSDEPSTRTDGEQPPAATVGDADRLAVTQAQHPAQVMHRVVVDRQRIQLLGIDQHMGAGRSQRRQVHPAHRQWNADLMRLNRPSFSCPTTSPRPSA